MLACVEDNDILRTDTAAPAPTTTPPDNTDPTQNPDDNLDETDQLNSGGNVCDVSACGTPSMGVACCTNGDDVTANRAVEAGKCGVDMTTMGFPGCVQKDQPGTLDSACPAVPFPPAPDMPGCCTASGHCGGMETFMGFGCTSNPDSTTWVACGS
jgi:hypothetical protein